MAINNIILVHILKWDDQPYIDNVILSRLGMVTKIRQANF